MTMSTKLSPSTTRSEPDSVSDNYLFKITRAISRLLMQDDPARQRSSGARNSPPAWWLVARIHLGALVSQPMAYLLAVWWRVSGKRVRSRARLAPLLGNSSHAYRLWLLREPALAQGKQADEALVKLVALVDLSDESGSVTSLADTLQSLACEGIPALVIGSSAVPDAATAAVLIDASPDVWLMPVAAGDVLRPGAAAQYRASASAGRELIYADDDVFLAGKRTSPHFKPDWNAELFKSHDFLTYACIIRASACNMAEYSGRQWASQLVESMVAATSIPHHIPSVLHHRRVRPAPRIPAAIARSSSDLPTMTVIVPTRNRHDLLHTCIEGLQNTDYPCLDIIVIDNASDDPETLAYLDALPPPVRVLRHPGPFNFAAMNNRAAEQASGQLLCLLNNDIEVMEPQWLRTMVQQALREDVGAVGAQLLYSDGRIQHAGVVTGVGGAAAHAHRLLRPEDEGYFRRHALPQYVAAVTAACLVVKRERFTAVGGFDEINFAVAFNDVDLCLRLNRRGWQSLYEPRAQLLHHESVSRGLDRDPVGAARLAAEIESLKTAWRTDENHDPFHHPELSRFSERFVVQL